MGTTKKIDLVGRNPTVDVTFSWCYELTGRKLNFHSGKHWHDIFFLFWSPKSHFHLQIHKALSINHEKNTLLQL